MITPNTNSVGLINSLHNIMNLLDTITELLPEGIYLKIQEPQEQQELLEQQDLQAILVFLK